MPRVRPARASSGSTAARDRRSPCPGSTTPTLAIAALQRGELVALKGLGGYQLVCDATRADSIATLRARKHRDARPFALMARDLDVVRRYGVVGEIEERALKSAEGPVVLLDARGPDVLPREVAPGLTTLGFMLPTTPLHAILLHDLDRPVVMTSGNVSGEPQVIDDADMPLRLAGIADAALTHDRPIANRVDDSVVRVVGGRVRLLRRARGYAPRPIRLPEGFERAPALVAYGADLKSTFCLARDGEATLSQHQGDLDDLATLGDYERSLALYGEMLALAPAALAADRHPDYASSTLARARAAREGLPLVEVQHHHAHAAACLAENGYPLDGPPVLAIVLDGLGYGDDGAIWGGELLVTDYREYRRVATLRPTAMIRRRPGFARALAEPLRTPRRERRLGRAPGELRGSRSRARPRGEAARDDRRHAARGLQRAARLVVRAPLRRRRRGDRRLVRATGLRGTGRRAARSARRPARARRRDDALAYPMTTSHVTSSRADDGTIACLDPGQMWRALLRDLAQRTPASIVSARFHRGLARAVADMAAAVARRDGDGPPLEAVALSGGCFQNRVLFEEVSRRLAAHGLRVLSHANVPPNDGGIALGQAVVAAARLISERT